MVATRSLSECAETRLQSAIDEAPDEDPVILWWDLGGDLRDIVANVSRSLDCAFHVAEHTPLELRANVPRDRTVWYASLPRDNVDWLNWFKDVEHTCGIIKQNIGKLAVRCFDQENHFQATSIRNAYEEADEDDRKQIAQTLREELNGRRLPELQVLQTQIVLGGYEDAVQFVLEHEAESLPEGDDLQTLRKLLLDAGVTAVEDDTDPDTIVEKTRRWAVAQWLVEEELDEALLEPEYRFEQHVTDVRPKLQSTLSKAEQKRKAELAWIYLNPENEFWHRFLRSYHAPWELADCPVDASLEHGLWDEWKNCYNNGEYEQCATKAKLRHDRLQKTYGAVPWTHVWRQAIEVAELAEALTNWEESDNSGDVVNLYGDIEDGSWQIDRRVFDLTVSGEPEENLPDEHPATATLAEFRRSLVESRYLDYLTDLGDLVTDQIEDGSPFAGKEHKHAHWFFDEEEVHFNGGQSVVLFIIDALRFDLAHELAESIRNKLDTIEVDESAWVGTLPSETEFGKAALTPGSKFNFEIELEDWDLVPKRSGQKITTYRRQRLLENDGWSYITQRSDNEAGWSNKRVAYYWNDIDDLGELGLQRFQEQFSDRIERISAIICEKLRKGEWDRAYVLSDHGFVSHPNCDRIDTHDTPDDAAVVKRRWIAGTDLDEDAPGVLLDEKTHLGYLEDDTRISVLADPNKRFGGRGIESKPFFHGGGLPQEFVLNFITITQA